MSEALTGTAADWIDFEPEPRDIPGFSSNSNRLLRIADRFRIQLIIAFKTGAVRGCNITGVVMVMLATCSAFFSQIALATFSAEASRRVRGWLRRLRS